MGIISIFEQFLPWLYIALTVGLTFLFFVKKTSSLIKPAVFLVLFLEISKSIITSLDIYTLWQGSSISKFLLPPYQGIEYFLGYVGYRFFLPLLFSVLVGLIFFFLASGLNKRKGERFLEKEEPWFLLFSILVVGHPLWVIYLAAILILAIFISLIRLIFKFDQVLSLYYFWLPIALVILIFSVWIVKWGPLDVIKF